MKRYLKSALVKALSDKGLWGEARLRIELAGMRDRFDSITEIYGDDPILAFIIAMFHSDDVDNILSNCEIQG